MWSGKETNVEQMKADGVCVCAYKEWMNDENMRQSMVEKVENIASLP